MLRLLPFRRFPNDFKINTLLDSPRCFSYKKDGKIVYILESQPHQTTIQPLPLYSVVPTETSSMNYALPPMYDTTPQREFHYLFGFFNHP